MIRVLYVDDDADICEIADMALSLDPELEVRTCNSGRDAVALAGTWHPDLVLLDFMMPVLDGPATLALLRELPSLAATPIVFITARTAERDVAALLSTGAVGVLAKPFDPLTLATRARSFLA